MKSFRYIGDAERVYVISKRHKNVRQGIIRNNIFTEPYVYNNGDTKNVVIAYGNYHLCELRTFEIVQPVSEYEYVVETQEVLVKDLKGICNMMRLPLVVVVSSYCDLEDKRVLRDLYYYQGKDDDEYISELRKYIS